LDITQENLHDLIVKAMEGDGGAFEALYKANSKSILFNARNLIYNANEVEDAAQEIIFQMYRSLPKLKSPYAFSAWMHRIIVNTCYRYNERHSGKANGPSLDEAEIAIEDTDADVRPAEAAEMATQSEELMGAIAQLPEKQRISLIMHYYDEMTFPQIGRALGVSEKTASTNVTKAKKNLKKILGDKYRISGTIEASFITVALKEEADKDFLAVDAEKFWRGCDARISGYRAEHAAAQSTGKAVNSGGKGFGLIVAVAICAALAITAGFLILHPFEGEKTGAADAAGTAVPTDESPEGTLPRVEIVLESEGDSPGNIDPKAAAVKIGEPGYTAVGWSISDGADGAVAAGQGDSIGEELKDLAPGDYRLSWTIKNAENNTATVYRDFTISS
jgi:RNA polymerase sigma-70 factor (ECF subfamily)